MEKYIYRYGAAALALVMGVLPASAFAQTNSAVTASVQTTINTNKTTNTKPSVKGANSGTSRGTLRPSFNKDAENPTAFVKGSNTSQGDKNSKREQYKTRLKNKIEKAREINKRQIERSRVFVNEHSDKFASSSEKAKLIERAREMNQRRAEKARELIKESRNRISSTSDKVFSNERAREQFKQRMENIREAFKNRIEFMREGTTTPVHTLAQLKKMIIARRARIKSEVASTTIKYRKIVAQATSVRVAVQALLASKDLLGTGVGQKVSELAKQVNNSVASTTNVEAQIQSRGFFTRLFFGGDTRAADAIKKQVIQNQNRIKALSGLLSESSTTQEVKTELGDQVQAMQDEQSRLQEVAQRQSSLWGLFSWRLF